MRINGDGTIRLIYNGESVASTGSGTLIATNVEYNLNSNNNAYVGYMYTTGTLRGLSTNSNIKATIDEWYENNLSSYSSYIDYSASFCGDRTPSTSESTSNGSGGTGTTKTYYGAYIRLYLDGESTSSAPSFKCNNTSDLYTTSSASKGNKALTYPIGLITADEVVYAGGVAYETNDSFFLYNAQDYWTMTPWRYTGSYSNVFGIYSDGYMSAYSTNSDIGVRPVINMRADVKLTGSGTSSNPYVIS